MIGNSSNNVIISDRYLDSTLAYQGYGKRVKVKDLNLINSCYLNDNIPDITFLLVINPKIAISRMKTLNTDNVDMNKNFLFKVQKGYMKLAKKEAFMYNRQFLYSLYLRLIL